MKINWVQIAMMTGYMAILIGVGLFMSRKVKNTTDYWLAGRQVGPLATAVSTCAAYYSTVAMIGGPPLYFAYGIGYSALELIGSVACCGVFIYLVFGLKMRAVSERVNIVSLPGFLAVRYKKNSIRLLSALIIGIMMIPYAVSAMKGIGEAMQSIAGIPYEAAVIVIGIVCVFYLITSGYWGVATTDIIQGIMIVVAVILLAIVCVTQAGGLTNVFETMRAEDEALMEVPGVLTWPQIFSYAWVWPLIAFGQPQLLTKFMGMKDTRTIKTVISISAVWLAVTCLCGNLVGFSAYALLGNERFENIDMLAPELAARYGGTLVSGIFMCGALAAGLSTLVALTLTSSSAIAKDLYEDWYSIKSGRKIAPEASMKASRLVTFVVMLIVIYLSIRPWDFIWQLSTMAAGTLGAAFTAPLTLGLYWKKGTTEGCIASMAGGALVSVVWYALGLTEIVHSFVPGTIVSFILFFIVSKCTKPLPQRLVDVFFEKECDLKVLNE